MKKYRPLFFILCLLLLVSCDSVFNHTINESISIVVRSGLTEACGKQDKTCIAAVNAQFDACHKKYNKEWHAYMNAGWFVDDDKLLDIYTKRITGCIVDADGDPYFAPNTKK